MPNFVQDPNPVHPAQPTQQPIPGPAPILPYYEQPEYKQAQAQNANVIQGYGYWGDYSGPGSENINNPARIAALQKANFSVVSQINQEVSPVATKQLQSPAGLTIQELQNRPLTDIERQYGSNVAEFVSNYSKANPSARAQAIQNQYEQQRYDIFGSSGVQRYLGVTPDNKYAVYSEAGSSTPFQANVLTEYQKGTLGNLGASGNATLKDVLNVRGIESLPTSLFSSLFTVQPQQPKATVKGGADYGGDGITAMPGVPTNDGRLTKETMDIYVPYGERTQQKVEDVKLVYDPLGGAFGGYQAPASIYEAPGGFHRIYGFETTGGSSGALQSGMFSIKPLTPDVREQYNADVFAKEANIAAALEIAKNPEAYSRLGAEAYGGIVKPLDNRTLGDAQLSRYLAESGNLANLVSPTGANLRKSEMATEKIPWGITDFTNAPTIQGVTKTSTLPSGLKTPVMSGGITLPTPFKSTYTSKETNNPLIPSVSAAEPTSYQSPFVGPVKPVEQVAPSNDILGSIGGFFGGLFTPQQSVKGGLDIGSQFVATETPQVYNVQPKGHVFGFQIPGVSNVLAFFQPGEQYTITGEKLITPEVTTLIGSKETPSVMTYQGRTITPTETGYTITDLYKTTGGTTDIYKTVGGESQATKVAVSPTLSGWDLLNKQIGSYFPSAKEGEAAMSIASLAIPPLAALTLPGAIETATTGRTTQTELFNPFAGQYTQFKEQPLLSAGAFAAGVGFGAIAKGVETAYMGTRGIAAERIISQGGLARGAEQFGAVVMERAPQILGALYGADVTRRATEGFTNFAPESVLPKARSIVIQEAAPMGAGFALPGQAITAARLSDIGYKAALQEGATTGRFDYYFKEPVTRPYELLKQDYASFVQERSSAKILPEERIAQDILTIQKTLTSPGTKENAFVYSTITGERIATIQGETPTSISNEALLPKLRNLGETRPIEEDFLLYHTHPKTPVSEQVTEMFGATKRGVSAVVSGEITPTQFVSGIKSYSKLLITDIPETTPSTVDIMSLRLSANQLGVVREGVISEGKLVTYNTDIGGKITPKGVYRAFAQAIEQPSKTLSEAEFIRTGKGLGFEPTIQTRSQLKELAPKEYGVVDYLKYKTTEPASIAVKSFMQEAPGKISGAVESAYGKYFEFKTQVPIAAESAVYTGLGKYYDVKATLGTTLAGEPGVTRATKATPVSDFIASAYSKYYDIRANVIGGTPAAEIVRSPVAPENEFSFVYPKGEGGVTEAFFSKSLSRIIPPSTFGETPVPSKIATVSKEGPYGSRVTTGGEQPPTTPFERITGTKVVGGRTVPALAKEPSLRSIGQTTLPESVRTTPIGQRADFRGQPVSQSMKPMGKQAAGIGLFTEPLPQVEGMPQTPRAAQPFIGAPTRGIVQVTQPEYMLPQEQRGRTTILSVPQAVITAQPQALETRRAANVVYATDVMQRSRQQQFTTQLEDITARRGITQRQREIVSPLFGTRTADQYATRFDTRVTTRFDTGFDQKFTQDVTQRQKQWEIQTPSTRDWTKTKPVEIITPKEFGGGLTPPSGFGGMSPFGRKRRGAFVETFMLGLDLSVGGRRTKKAKSYKTPKSFKRKRK